MNSQSTLIGLFKRTFSDKINDLTRAEFPMTDLIRFEDKIGESFQQPVDLTFEQAFTSAVNTVTPSGAAYGGYLDPIAGLTDRALVTPFSIHGRASVNYTSVSEAAAKGDKAFAAAIAHVVKRMTRSHGKRQEIQLLRGRRGIGVIESGNSPGGGVATFVVTAGSWAEGLWSGMVGARLDVYLSTGLKSTQASAITITGVAPATRTISCSGASVATGLDLLAVAGSYVTFETALIAGGAANTNEMPGLKEWNRNTGLLFNINATTQPLWAGNAPNDAFGTPSLSKLLDVLTSPSSYGLNNALSVAIVSPRAFNTMVSDQAALRRFPASEKTGRNGFSYLEFNCQTGVLRLQPHAFQADGDIDIFAPDAVKRIGSQEIDFIQGAGDDAKLILQSATMPAGEMRTLSNLTLFCEFPRNNVSVSGVTY